MMRKINKLILMCLISIMTLTAEAQSRKTYDWTRTINAIIQVESGGDKNAYNRKGDCVGVLQITPVLVKQCNILLKAQKSNKRYTLQDRYDVEKSKEMFIIIQEYYNPSHNIEKAIRLWNGGPGYSKATTEKYYHKVMKRYNGE